MFIHSYGPVGEGDGVAETGLPLDSLLGEIHDNLGSFGIRMEQKWADRKGSTDGATLDRQAPLGFVVTSVRCGWKLATERICQRQNKEVSFTPKYMGWIYSVNIVHICSEFISIHYL